MGANDKQKNDPGGTDDMAGTDTTAAVQPEVPTVAPGIPAVEVNPSNELLDGENLDRKRDLIENEPVHVDASGTRLEHDDGDVIPPPASANLELRQRTEKLIAGTLSSMGKGEDSPDSMLGALRAERDGLQRRADDGDEKAQRRVSQVDEQIKTREKAAGERKSSAEESAEDSSGDPVQAQKAAPTGRTGRPKTEATGTSK